MQARRCIASAAAPTKAAERTCGVRAQVANKAKGQIRGVGACRRDGLVVVIFRARAGDVGQRIVVVQDI